MASSGVTNGLSHENNSGSKHMNSNESSTKNYKEDDENIKLTLPMARHEVFKWNGWGYLDSGFRAVEDEKEGVLVYAKGNRYELGTSALSQVVPTAKKLLEFPIDHKVEFLKEYPSFPDPILNQDVIKDLQTNNLRFSTDGMDRLTRSHGQSCQEMWNVKHGTLSRLVDAVVWPRDHDDVTKIISSAVQNNAVIIPVGGGTNVSGALTCPAGEKRMIIALDTTQMYKLLWLNEDNLTAHFQAGVVGQDLENMLSKRGYCCGHEPDSMEFSTLGGWIATRASGMKRGIYGNIEDIVINIKMATAIGTIERNCRVPRLSSGPDLQHFAMGSEGAFGVVTEATIKIRPLPEVHKYGSIVFPCFEDGVAFMRELAEQRCQIASVRLMDNKQVQVGKVVRQEPSYWHQLFEKIKQNLLVYVKGFDLEKISAATLLFEGSKEEVTFHEKRVYAVAAKHNGIAAGEEYGRNGYRMTYIVAYIRDFLAEYYVCGDSFETAVPWDRVLSLCRNVKAKIKEECEKRKIYQLAVSLRVTQVYDAGVCVYFYTLFCYYGTPITNAAAEYEMIEKAARQEVIDNGGSISHHHGVGKLQKPFLQKTISACGMEILKGIKEKVDPQNIFANGNLTM